MGFLFAVGLPVGPSLSPPPTSATGAAGGPTLPADVSTPAPEQPASGTVSGTVTYDDGRPLSGATVSVSAIGYLIDLTGNSDAQGNYLLALPGDPLRYTAAAWFDISYRDQLYHFPLEPVGGPPPDFGVEGLVQDFRWSLSGPAWWGLNETIGSSIEIYGYDPLADPAAENPLDAPAGAQIQLHLRPLEPLIDGSTGEELSPTVTIGRGPARYDFSPLATVRDVPVGRYELSARLLLADGSATPLRVTATCARSGPSCPNPPPPLATTAVIAFPPVDVTTNPRPYQGQPAADAWLYVITE
ncbi:MAG: carboxypeptidase-like regulatory domain-containing protein [Chloroflexota bacterium]|nr:carboxypeptidase-like regulatory domain-containing protein [Chloroflexota bacterium]